MQMASSLPIARYSALGLLFYTLVSFNSQTEALTHTRLLPPMFFSPSQSRSNQSIVHIKSKMIHRTRGSLLS